MQPTIYQNVETANLAGPTSMLMVGKSELAANLRPSVTIDRSRWLLRHKLIGVELERCLTRYINFTYQEPAWILSSFLAIAA